MSQVEDYEWRLTLSVIQQRLPGAKKILARAVVLRAGWEMDNEVCAVEMKGGERKIVTTSHGGVYEADADELAGYIEDYKKALEQTEAVLSAFRSP